MREKVNQYNYVPFLFYLSLLPFNQISPVFELKYEYGIDILTKQ